MATPDVNNTFAGLVAVQVRQAIPMQGERPACGSALFSAFKRIDNCLMVIRNGYIEDIGPRKSIRLPARCPVIDYGDCLLLPALVNAHTHLQLSMLDVSQFWGKGFAHWLSGMILKLLAIAPDGPNFATMKKLYASIDDACAQLVKSGCRYIGDIGGSIRGALRNVITIAQSHGLQSLHFCELFGFSQNSCIWPERCLGEIEENGMSHCAPAAHALYSTNPDIAQLANRWCKQNNRTFSFHLAESDDEVEMLLNGSGPLYDLYWGKVLPLNWKPPQKTPFGYAQYLGLLGKGTLAVHGVKMSVQEVAQFGASGSALCLCPRSNANLGVGYAPVWQLIDSGALLCLGTDGLTSNTDLDVRKEANFLHNKLDIPFEPLLRILTVNGASALGYDFQALAPGNPAQFALVKENGNSWE